MLLLPLIIARLFRQLHLYSAKVSNSCFQLNYQILITYNIRSGVGYKVESNIISVLNIKTKSMKIVKTRYLDIYITITVSG